MRIDDSTAIWNNMSTHSPTNAPNTGEILFYQTDDGATRIEATLVDETIWLTHTQMAQLFQKSPSTIVEHIRNIFNEQELKEDAVIRKFRITASDGKKYDTNHYSLDVIISVGYRVSSKRATQFRIWATGVLRGDGLASCIASIEQGFGDTLLYPNVANRAAHLLYFIIKNHPLVDGNKRTGAFLFLCYLRLNQHLLAKPVEQLINDHTLVALTLLLAESAATQKDLMTGLVEHFLLLKDTQNP